MPNIRYLVPYQIDVLAKDVTTGKRIGNTFYYSTGLQTTTPPAYGAFILGGGSTTTLLANFATKWEVLIDDVLSAKYLMAQYTMRAILGYGYGTPTRAINALVQTGTDTTIQTATPHGLTAGQFVRVSGVTTPANVNGTWGVVITSTTQFKISPFGSGVWSSDGTFQLAEGVLNFQYDDQEVLPSAAVGGVAGDALPIFCDVDVRRLNPGVGKSFRSRFAMSIVAESDNDFGKLTAAAMTRWSADLVTFLAAPENGGTDATSKFSHSSAVSKLKASMEGTPFSVSADSWRKYVTGYAPHARLGSQNNRKPRLAGT